MDFPHLQIDLSHRAMLGDGALITFNYIQTNFFIFALLPLICLQDVNFRITFSNNLELDMDLRSNTLPLVPNGNIGRLSFKVFLILIKSLRNIIRNNLLPILNRALIYNTGSHLNIRSRLVNPTLLILLVNINLFEKMVATSQVGLRRRIFLVRIRQLVKLILAIIKCGVVLGLEESLCYRG